MLLDDKEKLTVCLIVFVCGKLLQIYLIAIAVSSSITVFENRVVGDETAVVGVLLSSFLCTFISIAAVLVVAVYFMKDARRFLFHIEMVVSFIIIIACAIYLPSVPVAIGKEFKEHHDQFSPVENAIAASGVAVMVIQVLLIYCVSYQRILISKTENETEVNNEANAEPLDDVNPGLVQDVLQMNNIQQYSLQTSEL